MTSRGTRSIFSTPDAVTDLFDHGDRLDRLERRGVVTPGADVDAYYWRLVVDGDFSPDLGGRITFPAGWSKLEFVGSFQATGSGETLSGAGVIFDGDLEEQNFLAGGITTGSPVTATWQAAGVALVRTSATKRVNYRVRGQSSGGSPVNTLGALFVTPVRSVSAL